MPAPKYDQTTIDRMSEMRESGKSYKAIADRLGMTEGSVYWHCLRLGVEKPGKPNAVANAGAMVVTRGNYQVRRFSPEEDERLIAMDMAGETQAEMARKLGRKPNSIRGRLMTLARREERAMTA